MNKKKKASKTNSVFTLYISSSFLLHFFTLQIAVFFLINEIQNQTITRETGLQNNVFSLCDQFLIYPTQAQSSPASAGNYCILLTVTIPGETV